jgi:hypothetical protein
MEDFSGTSKACTVCGNSYPQTPEFWYKGRGTLFARCKPCVRAAERRTEAKYRARNHELGDAVYDGSDERCYKCGSVYPRDRKYFRKSAQRRDGLQPTCNACNDQACTAWKRSPANRAKVRAQVELSFALQVGDIERPTACEGCGETPSYALHGHHTSYDPADWLNVVWLCRKCHGKTRMVEAA